MDLYCNTAKSRLIKGSLVLMLSVAMLAAFAGPVLRAQELTQVGNAYVTGSMVTDRSSSYGGGRFVIDAGPFYNGYRFLYFITSNVVFRINTPGGTFYYTNAKPIFGGQPSADGVTAVPYRGFDSVYISTDTVAAIWKDLHGYTIELRMFPEEPNTIYDRGGDIVLEFSYSFAPFSAPADLGIFMMLDCYNGQAEGGGGGGDKSALLTTRGYFPTDGPGKVFQEPFEPIPEFYHVGNFLYQTPLNTVLPIHRLTGTTHGGLPLTSPEIFAVGNWRKLRTLAWDIDLGGLNVGDCATILRWSGLHGTGTVRTSFGMDDKEGNNVYHCRDQKIFVDIRTARLVEQTSKNGSYSPSAFNVEMWVTNTSDLALTATITFNTPIGAPNYIGRLSIDPSTPAVQVASIPVRQTAKMLWKLNLAPGTNDSLIDIPLDFRYQITGVSGGPRVFKMPCTPVVSIKGFREPPPPKDTLPPPIVRTSYSRAPYPTWGYRTFDRHPGYVYDTGLDRIVVERNDNANFQFAYAPNSFNRCDTTQTVNITARVADTTKSGYLVFAVYDCYGNVSRDSAAYNPRPDTFKPQVLRSDSLGSFGPGCNARQFDFYLIDSLNQTPAAGDVGFGSISVLNALDNFYPIEINFDRGGALIKPFDPRASFRFRVIDSMFDANATVRVVDFADNADTIQVHYCTLPDVQAPRSQVTPTPNPDPTQGPKAWTIDASDTLAWDRGLESVEVLDSSNMLFTPPGIKPGDRTTTFPVWVIRDSMDARITLEIRDRYYAASPAGHADTITLTFVKVPDTLAPNITYKPVPGSNGSVVDVDIDDIHFFGPTLYAYDRGLAQVRITSITANLRQLTLPTFSPGDMRTTFRFEVIDTLALTKHDTICVEAVDLYGNRSNACYLYPLQPDTLAPIVQIELASTFAQFTGFASDSRQYDRGLGSVTVENPVNLESGDINQFGLNGLPLTPIMIRVTDPGRAIAGTLVVRDRISEADRTSETEALHGVRIPFALPAVHLGIDLPSVVEGGGTIRASILALDSFPGSLVSSIAFTANYSGDARFTASRGLRGTLTTTDNGSQLSVKFVPDGTASFVAGDTVGVITFTSVGSNGVGFFSFAANPASIVVNNGVGATYSATKVGDTAISFVKLPAPTATLNADSTTYVNGVCQRVLDGSITAGGKRSGLAVLGLRPQPASSAASGSIAVDVRDLPREGATLELLGANGEIILRMMATGTGERITRVPVRLPAGTPSGLYVVRVRAAAAVAVAKVLVVD